MNPMVADPFVLLAILTLVCEVTSACADRAWVHHTVVHHLHLLDVALTGPPAAADQALLGRVQGPDG